MRGGLHTSGGQGTRWPPRAWRHDSYVVGLPGGKGLTAVPWLFQVIGPRSRLALVGHHLQRPDREDQPQDHCRSNYEVEHANLPTRYVGQCLILYFGPACAAIADTQA